MKLHFMTVPVFDSEEAEAALNRFLSSHRVLSISRELVSHETHCAWVICITYQDGKDGGPPKGIEPTNSSSGQKAPRVGYKEVLSTEQFQVFAQLRLLRANDSQMGPAVGAVDTRSNAHRWPAPSSFLMENHR